MAFRTNKMPVLQEKSASGSVATFNTALAMPLVNGEFTIQAYQEGSGDPSPVNERNIIPFNEVNITNRGANLISSWEAGYISATGEVVVDTTSQHSELMPVNVGDTYVYYGHTGVHGNKRVHGYNSQREWVEQIDYEYVYGNRDFAIKISIPNGISFIAVSNGIVDNTYFSIYKDYTKALGEDTYGGSYNSVTGKSKSNRKKITLDGTENYIVQPTGYIKSDACDAYLINNEISPLLAYNKQPETLCNKLKFSNEAIWLISGYPNTFTINNSQIHLNIANSELGITDYTQETPGTVKAKIAAWVANNNIDILIPVSETETQLGPTLIETYDGSNNIFCDTGDSSVSYKDLDIAKLGSFREVFKIPENTKKLYGFKIDYENKTIDYLEDAVGMTPAYMDFTNHKFEYGSWENAFFMPRPCMLKRDGTVDFYLDPNNYDYRSDGVTPSHVGHLGNYEASSTSSKDYAVDDYIVYDSKLYQVTSAITTGDTLTEGTNISEVENAPDVEDNAMLEWGQGGQHIWYRQITNLDGTESVYISNYRVNDTFNAWSFYDANGMLKDHFYTPIYQGSIVNNVLRSISGMDYTRYCKSKTGAQEVTLAEANNVGTDKGWYTEVNCDWVLTMHLLTLMSKSLNTSAKYGNGRCGQSSSETNMLTTGSMNDKGMFWGSNTNTYGVKVFGMENQWGNQWHRMAGLLLIDNQWYYKLTRYTNDGSTATDYNSTGTGYLTQTGHTAPTANYVQEMYFTDDGAFYDKVTGSSSSASVTMYQDYFYVNASGTMYALRGGHCYGSAVYCGACFVRVSNVFGSAYWTIGASVTYR